MVSKPTRVATSENFLEMQSSALSLYLRIQILGARELQSVSASPSNDSDAHSEL